MELIPRAKISRAVYHTPQLDAKCAQNLLWINVLDYCVYLSHVIGSCGMEIERGSSGL
jgi:hypothetical protein